MICRKTLRHIVPRHIVPRHIVPQHIVPQHLFRQVRGATGARPFVCLSQDDLRPCFDPGLTVALDGFGGDVCWTLWDRGILDKYVR